MDMVYDVIHPLKDWRIIYLRATQSIRSRFARSYLGQGWVTMSLAILILCTGIVWSLIWSMPIAEFLPYVAVGHVFYLFISGTINDSTTAIIADANFYRHKKYSFFLSIYTLLMKNLVVLLYNLPIVVLVVLWSDKVHPAISYTYPFYLMILIMFLFFASYSIAILCVYFRDFIQLVASILSVVFMLTPVMWNVNMIPEHLRHYVYINPLASCVELLRNPVIGLPVSQYAIMYVFIWLCISIFICVAFWKMLNKNSIYWI